MRVALSSYGRAIRAGAGSGGGGRHVWCQKTNAGGPWLVCWAFGAFDFMPPLLRTVCESVWTTEGPCTVLWTHQCP